jgi:hypothetical protein
VFPKINGFDAVSARRRVLTRGGASFLGGLWACGACDGFRPSEKCLAVAVYRSKRLRRLPDGGRARRVVVAAGWLVIADCRWKVQPVWG